MGMTLWIHTLENREYAKDSDDHSLMNLHIEALDALCDELGVRKLTEFMDYTGLEYSYGEFDEDEEEDAADPEIDPETDLAYGIDDMTWFDAAEGLAALQALRHAVAGGRLGEVTADETERLIEELDDCIAVVDGPASRGGRFHLTIVE